MAILSPPASSVAASLRRGAPPHPSPSHLASPSPLSRHRPSHPRPVAISSRLHSSRASFSGARSSSSPGGGEEEVHNGSPAPPRPEKSGAAVYVTLPVDAVGAEGQITRKKTMGASFMALAAAGVEGVAVEVWWGVVERGVPGEYDWDGYLELVALAAKYGLKVRAIIGFHQHGSGPGDPCWIPLPNWVLEEMRKDPDLAYTDRFGRRSSEYISLGCDTVAVLKGRTPIQAYTDFLINFRNAFKNFLGVTITEIQIGMGPSGELRYPSFLPEKTAIPDRLPELGEFQCYDKFMIASLNARALDSGMNEWGNGGPLGAGSLFQDPERTTFFKSDGSWNTPYGRFFLEWYSGMLLLHAERLCMCADIIFLGTGVKLLGKIAGIPWHYSTNSHPSELTAGYYNTVARNGYLPIAEMFARYKMILCCTCFDLRDSEEQTTNPNSSPEGLLKQLLYAAKLYNLSLTGENSRIRMDDTSLQQVIRTSKLYLDSFRGPSLSFNFVRMNKHLFESYNWTRFTRFVRQMSDARTFQAKLDRRRMELCSTRSFQGEEIRALACH